VETFEPERGFKFETFAGHKIRGAILDELRALDWVPRSVRQKSRDLQRVYAKLENSLGRAPYDDEVCEELNISMSAYEELLAEVTPTTIISLEEAMPERGSDSKDLKIIDSIEDPGSENPLKELGFTEVKEILKDTIANLPEKEKLVIALYHYEELTLKEIGVVLDITESRVSQIHSKAILKLRAKLLQRINA
jgi:RNA polymerase sigma factor FliA